MCLPTVSPIGFIKATDRCLSRFELVDEFRICGWRIISYCEVFRLPGSFGAKDEVVKDVQQKEAKLSPSVTTLASGFSAEAHAAVGRWLAIEYPSRIIQPEDEGVDFTVADGSKLIGVEVKALAYITWKATLLAMIERTHRSLVDEFSESMICIVGSGSKAAKKVLVQMFKQLENHSGATHLCVGWLEADNTFMVESRFSDLAAGFTVQSCQCMWQGFLSPGSYQKQKAKQ